MVSSINAFAQIAVDDSVKKFINNFSSYGVVVNNEIGTIQKAEYNTNTNELIAVYKTDNQLGQLKGKIEINVWNVEVLSTNTEFEVKFNDDGTAKGKSVSGEHFFILLGEKSKDRTVISDLSKRGLRAISMKLIVKNKLPGHDASVWFYHKTDNDNYSRISFVFPIDFKHPNYGFQNRVRTFVYYKVNGKWNVKEDNTNVTF